MKIGIITDSTADLPPTTAAERGISVVPTLIMMNGQTWLDGEGMSREEFYEKLPVMDYPPTTGAPSPEAFARAYQQKLDEGCDQLLVLTAPANLSGIYNSANTAAREFGDRIHLFDSGQLSMGLGFQVLKAAELIRQSLPMEAVLSSLETFSNQIRLFAMLDSTVQLKRSGRVSWAKSIVSDLLELKLFIQLEKGQVLRSGMSRRRSGGISKLQNMLNNLGNLEYLAVLHTNAFEEAQMILEQFPHQIRNAPFVLNVTTIIGSHVGSNGLGFTAVPEK